MGLYTIKVLFSGFSRIVGDFMQANCSCTLIKGPNINCIVDTMTAWDGSKIQDALKEESLTPNDISHVICTHGHSDHIGCNYLFQNAIHIVGFSVSKRDKYFLSPDFQSGEEYHIDKNIKVVPTPGHTLQDVSVIFNDSFMKRVYAVTGDLFEREEDLENDDVWVSAGSDDTDLQRANRQKILGVADFIVPGHGPMFEVPVKHKLITSLQK